MSKLVVITSCVQCHHVGYIATRDEARPRVYVGCDKSQRSFNYQSLNSEAIPIPDWCELENAPEPVELYPEGRKPNPRVTAPPPVIVKEGYGI